MLTRKLVAAALLLGSVFAQTAGATTYDTTSAWNGSDGITPFGSPNTATYGQTFIAPSDHFLKDFTFHISGGASLQFQAQVYSWSGSLFGGGGGGATGAPLFTSSPITFGPTLGFVPVTIPTGSLNLTAGGQYVALFTISGPDPTDYTNSSGTDAWGFTPFSHPAGDGGGGFVFYNNGSNYAALNSTVWDNFADFGDSAWTAHFAAPEPATLALFGAGLAGLGAMRRRRKAKA